MKACCERGSSKAYHLNCWILRESSMAPGRQEIGKERERGGETPVGRVTVDAKTQTL